MINSFENINSKMEAQFISKIHESNTALNELHGGGSEELKESKDIVDNLPHILKEKVLKDEAEKIKSEFEINGGKITIK